MAIQLFRSLAVVGIQSEDASVAFTGPISIPIGTQAFSFSIHDFKILQTNGYLVLKSKSQDPLFIC